MKRLDEERAKVFFEKLAKYIGENVKHLIDRPDGTYCFREQNNKVYYVSEKILKLAENVGRDRLISLGCCMGKFSKTNKFKFNITALTYLAPYAQYKVWLKASAEQQYLYGNHISKSGLGRITENTPKHQGVVVYSMNDLPLGFGVTARSTAECKVTDPLTTVCFHQADIGEYIRSEETLF
ncbi:60S ribosome subunit biogenesis protein NIP7 homolog [Contarinia nasturtii]|uniref:60S ribosome subunit biogenesis protein NIP7 homolog n=1 Tax=Contarinia nasturtii TaxID=265458 RepID=UPI0012D42BDD|nr:60S ribosome subunit biogenesis protein NIP7 homolog [Contarinia nasturtii]